MRIQTHLTKSYDTHQRTKYPSTMAIKKREELKQPFSTGKILTQTNFYDLLDSVLIRREDRFFGQWQTGVEYLPGDVVLHGAETCDSKLYVLQINEASSSENPKTEGYCATVFDPNRWKVMELNLEDDDWHVVQADIESPEIVAGDQIMYAKVYGKIGIGTDCPETRLHIRTDDIGQIQLDPDGQADPTLSIQKLVPDCDTSLHLSSGEESACFLTDAPMGFLLKQSITNNSADAREEKEEEKILVLAMFDPDSGATKLGVNADAPQAMLDLVKEGFGQWMVLPDGREYPEVVLLNLSDECDTNYYATRLEEKTVSFYSDAPDGYLFKKGEEWTQYAGEGDPSQQENILAIQSGPKVGIGTADPETALDVTDGVAGRLQFAPKSPQNPALSIINTRQGPNYLTLGTDNYNGIITTDSANGLLFKAGGDYGTNNNHLNLNQGTQLARLTKEGQLAIGSEDPDGYQLEVFGVGQSFGFYLPTDTKRVDEQSKLTNVLPGICEISPIKFTWKENTNCAGEGTQIGLLAGEVDDNFPECVRKVGTKLSVAYPNLVAVLLQGIKEQQSQIQQLTDTIKSLDDRLCALEENQSNS